MSALPQQPWPQSARISIVPMRSAQLDEVMHIEQAIYEFPWTRGNFQDAIAAGYDCLELRDILDFPATTNLPVAASLVGYGILMHVPDQTHLLNLSVAPARQRHGYAREGLQLLYHCAKSVGSESITLEVRPSNAPAFQLYRSEGFDQVGLRRGYYPARGGREDALVLTRAL